MTDKATHHRPLLASIRIRASHDEGSGTLTGLGRDISDDQEVLVTNLHVIRGILEAKAGNQLQPIWS